MNIGVPNLPTILTIVSSIRVNVERNRNQSLLTTREECVKSVVGLLCLDVFDFHHIDPDEKDIKVADWMGRIKWATLKKELDKCILLCSNCHRIHHAELREEEYEANP